VLRIEGKECRECIEPIKIHLYKTLGIKGVRAKGHDVAVIYNDRYEVEDIIKETGVDEYYRVLEASIVNYR